MGTNGDEELAFASGCPYVVYYYDAMKRNKIVSKDSYPSQFRTQSKKSKFLNYFYITFSLCKFIFLQTFFYVALYTEMFQTTKHKPTADQFEKNKIMEK